MARIYTEDELTFIKDMAGKLENIEEIPEDTYSKFNVKRGLRNANGTGVVVGLTRVGEADVDRRADDAGRRIEQRVHDVPQRDAERHAVG